MIYPLVSELAVDGIPVTVTCRVLGLARYPYYRWRNRPVATATWERAHRVNALIDAHLGDPEFAYRFLANEARKAGLALPPCGARFEAMSRYARDP